MINTHADGKTWLNAEGAEIVAHENTHKHLMSAQRVDVWNFNFSPLPLAAIPTNVFDTEKSLTLNRWDQFVITPEFFTRLVYQGV